MFCFCFCSLQLTWYRSILFILAHLSQALDIVTDFPFCFCSVIYWMIYIFHACRGWSDMMELEKSAVTGNLAAWLLGRILLSVVGAHWSVPGSCLSASLGRELWFTGMEVGITCSLCTSRAVPVNLCLWNHFTSKWRWRWWFQPVSTCGVYMLLTSQDTCVSLSLSLSLSFPISLLPLPHTHTHTYTHFIYPNRMIKLFCIFFCV